MTVSSRSAYYISPHDVNNCTAATAPTDHFAASFAPVNSTSNTLNHLIFDETLQLKQNGHPRSQTEIYEIKWKHWS